MYGSEWVSSREGASHHTLTTTSDTRTLQLNRQALGNFGLSDQRLGLQWAQRNLHAFGGDAPAVRIEPRLHRCVGRFRFLRTIALWVQVSISVFEEPSWCGASGCGDPKVVLTFGLPVFPKALTASAELGCLIMMGSFMMLRALSLRADPSAFIAQRSNLVQVALLGLSFTVIVLDVLLGDVGTGFFASAFNPVPPAVIRPFLFLACVLVASSVFCLYYWILSNLSLDSCL